MWLAIDTATDQASVALGVPGAAPLEESVAGARRHAAALLPMIEALFSRAGASLDDLAGVLLSDGPGSFTGLRVGAAVAKALVQARGLPLWTAPSLLVRAAGVARNEELVLAVANALRGEVYAAAYRFLPARVVVEMAPTVRRPADLMASARRPAVVVGDVPDDMRAALESWAGRPMVGSPEGAPHAARLIELMGKPGGATRVLRVAGWEPAYGRPAEAQARWEIAHGRPLPDSIGRPG